MTADFCRDSQLLPFVYAVNLACFVAAFVQIHIFKAYERKIGRDRRRAAPG